MLLYRLNLLHVNTTVNRGVSTGGDAHERVEIGQKIRGRAHVVVFDFHSDSQSVRNEWHDESAQLLNRLLI